MRSHHHQDLEERKVPARGGAAGGKYNEYAMLSQDSLKQIELAFEHETVEEREKLKEIEKTRKEFAKRLRET